jgi:hypothetical protein
MLTYVRTGTAGGIFIQIMQINNKNVYKIHNTYAVLYTQSPLASVGNVSPDEGIREIVIRLVTTVARKFI